MTGIFGFQVIYRFSLFCCSAGIMVSALPGSVLGPMVLRLAGVPDRRAIGLALGCASIGVGATRAFAIDATAGAFASIGMSLTAIWAALGATVASDG